MTVRALFPLLDFLSANFEYNNCAHDADGASTNSGGKFIDGGAYSDAFEGVEQSVAGSHDSRVDHHARALSIHPSGNSASL